MKQTFLPITRLFLATLAGISFTSLLVAQPSLAQLNSVDANTSIDPQGNSNPLSNSNSGNFDFTDLIHRANFGNIYWNDEAQNQQLDSAAAGFRAKQQQLFQGKQQPTPGVTFTTPQGATPQSISIPANK
jgi:hypothetical protein